MISHRLFELLPLIFCMKVFITKLYLPSLPPKKIYKTLPLFITNCGGPAKYFIVVNEFLLVINHFVFVTKICAVYIKVF